MDTLKPDARNVLTGGACKTFCLWSQEANWYAPSERSQLVTTPGIYVKESKGEPQPPVNEILLRYTIDWIKELTRRGAYSTGEDWNNYLAKPFKVMPPNPVPISCVLESDTLLTLEEKEQEISQGNINYNS